MQKIWRVVSFPSEKRQADDNTITGKQVTNINVMRNDILGDRKKMNQQERQE